MPDASLANIPWWGWAAFGVVVTILLVVDLFAHRGEHAESRKSALVWTLVWIGTGLAFCGFMWAVFGAAPAQEYLAAYLIEKSLSLDNLFVFLIIFQTLSIPSEEQHRVLFWGIFGAVIFRGIFIFAGAAAVQRWDWMSYVFGGILLLAAIHAFREEPGEKDTSRIVKWLSQHLPLTHNTHGHKFLTKVDGAWMVTPLLIALAAVELTDILFAIDSVPAAFSVSNDPFIIYSSNVFAILGLRALYLLLADMLDQLDYLHYGLSVILGFAAVKILIEDWVHIPAMLSVAIIGAIIAVTVWMSVAKRRRDRKSEPHGGGAGASPEGPDEIRNVS